MNDSRSDLGIVLASAISYAIGKRSYTVSTVIDYALSHAADLSGGDRALLVKIVRSALQRNEVHYDVQAWRAFATAMEGHDER